MTVLGRYDLIKLRKRDVPITSEPCIYFLWDSDFVVYIGQSLQAVKRIGTHISEGSKIFDAVTVLPVEAKLLDIQERLYIREYAPKYNTAGTSGEEKLEKMAGELELQAGIMRYGNEENPDLVLFASEEYPTTLKNREQMAR